MQKILVLGAGKIGSLVASLLAHSNDYQVYLGDILTETDFLKTLADQTPHLEIVKLDAANDASIKKFLHDQKIKALVSCLPFYRNATLVKIARELNLYYFDPTEDTETAKVVAAESQHITSAFVPQCGLAPGFISIIANHLMQDFPEIDTVKMRVGALPVTSSNALQYSLTWSTDGLINEYSNACHAIENGRTVNILPLDGLEEIKIDGLTYEAFNTSGGIGTLVDTYAGKVKQLNYKTIRYPGHCAKMRFLMQDLRLTHDRDTLKRILEAAVPKTLQDVVLVYVSVSGKRDNYYFEENYVKKFYPKTIRHVTWSAIQLTTATSLCAVLDIVMQSIKKFQGLIKQEQISLDDFTQNRFGQYYA